MRDIIEIEKTELPCSYDIVLGAEEFRLTFKYNEECDLFTCTLSKDGEVLVYDEPIVYGVPLFQDVYDSDTFPCIDIVPLDESGEENEVNYDNFGETVFLTIDDESDEDEEETDEDDAEYYEDDYDYE
jgi:hypothetical protein